MDQEIITVESGKLNDYLHLVDLREFGLSKILAAYICEFDNSTLVLDAGSSIEVKRIWRYAKKNNISLSSIKYIIPSQHHFDHAGGIWRLYKEVKKHNPDVKILANQITKELLNDFEHHLNRAKRTYNTFAGVMNPIEENAFEIIEPSRNFANNPNKLDFIKKFSINGDEIELAIMKTPGHTPDHQCPLFVRNGEIDFLYSGEAVGTIYHSSKLVSMPTSMPIYFKYPKFMETLENLQKLKTPHKLGYTHFGIVNGAKNVKYMIEEQKEFMQDFRSKVIKYFNEKPETSYVFKRLIPYFLKRTDIVAKETQEFYNIILGVVYGMLISENLRDLDDLDKKMIEKYQNK